MDPCINKNNISFWPWSSTSTLQSQHIIIHILIYTITYSSRRFLSFINCSTRVRVRITSWSAGSPLSSVRGLCTEVIFNYTLYHEWMLTEPILSSSFFYQLYFRHEMECEIETVFKRNNTRASIHMSTSSKTTRRASHAGSWYSDNGRSNQSFLNL